MQRTEKDHPRTVTADHHPFEPDTGIDEWLMRLGRRELPQELQESHDHLWKEIKTAGFPESEQKVILNAEAMLFSALADEKPRNDGRPLPWHSLEVARIVVSEMHGSATSVVKALLHDTVEDDTDGHITESVIRDRFGESIALSVIALTKARSRSMQTLELRTKYNIVRQIAVDTEDVAVKLADRLHYFRTLIHPVTGQPVFEQGKIAAKAAETMDLYVPLAVSLGFHDVEQELANSAIFYLAKEKDLTLRLKYEPGEYRVALKPFEDAVSRLKGLYIDTGKTTPLVTERSKIRIPRFDDAWKAVDGKIEDIPEAEVPNIVALIVSSPDAPSSVRDGIDFWYGSVEAVAHDLLSQELITGATYAAIHDQIRDRRRSVRVTDRGNGIPTRLLFIRPEDDNRRAATVFDALREGADPERALHASTKIANLRTTFESMLAPSMETTLEDLSYCLKAGGTITVMAQKKPARRPEPVGVAPDATWLDVFYTLAGERRSIPYISKARVFWARSTLHDLGDQAQEGMNVQFLSVRTGEIPSFSPEWFDMAHMPSTKRKIRQALENHLDLDALKNPDSVDRNSLTAQIIKRGFEKINSLFRIRGFERGLPVRDLELPLTLAADTYNSDAPVFTVPNSQYAQYYNFLLCVGLEYPGYVPNAGRTSVADRVAQTMLSAEYDLTGIRCQVPHAPGQLLKIAEILHEYGVNIVEVTSRRDEIVPDGAYVTILMTQDDLKKLSDEALRYLNAKTLP